MVATFGGDSRYGKHIGNKMIRVLAISLQFVISSYRKNGLCLICNKFAMRSQTFIALQRFITM